jgi:hypothetical protein
MKIDEHLAKSRRHFSLPPTLSNAAMEKMFDYYLCEFHYLQLKL